MRITSKGQPDKRCGSHNKDSKVNWDEIAPLFGTIPDAEIGRRYGLSRERVRQVRKQHNQAPWKSTLRERTIPLLGKISDREIAKQLGVTDNWVGVFRRKQGVPRLSPVKYDWAKVDASLGVLSDSEIARTFGASLNAVFRRRTDKGIPAKPRGVNWGNEPDLGKLPDKFLAERYGVCLGAVSQARKRRGIPTWLKANKGGRNP